MYMIRVVCVYVCRCILFSSDNVYLLCALIETEIIFSKLNYFDVDDDRLSLARALIVTSALITVFSKTKRVSLEGSRL